MLRRKVALIGGACFLGDCLRRGLFDIWPWLNYDRIRQVVQAYEGGLYGLFESSGEQEIDQGF